MISGTQRTSRKNAEKTKPILTAFCVLPRSSSVAIRTGGGSYFYGLKKIVKISKQNKTPK